MTDNVGPSPGGVKCYLPILNWPSCYQRGWLSAGLMAAVSVLTLLELDQKGVHIVDEITFMVSSGE